MSRKSQPNHDSATVAVLDAPAEPPQGREPDPAAEATQRAENARANLTELRERLAALDAQEQEHQQALAAFDARTAELNAQRDAQAAEAMELTRHQIPRARAMVASLHHLSGEKDARDLLEKLERRGDVLAEEMKRASAIRAKHEAQAASEGERIAGALDVLATTRGELVGLVAAFEDEARQAHLDAGQAVLERLQAQHQQREEALGAAVRRVERLRAYIEQHQAHAREQLRQYPSALQEAEGGPLLPRTPSAGEQLLSAYDQWLAVLEAHSGGGNPVIGGRYVSSQVCTLAPHHVAHILQDPIAGKRFAAEQRALIAQAIASENSSRR